jgi:hypothetical protein
MMIDDKGGGVQKNALKIDDVMYGQPLIIDHALTSVEVLCDV